MAKQNAPLIEKKSDTRAADTVVAALEERIYSGALRDGQMLPAERELIEEFGISRTVAREAVKILGGKGLVEARPRYRPVVKRPDYDTVLGVLGGLVKHLIGQPGGVKQVFDIRIFVEAGLVRMAALQAQKADIASLREALERNRDCIEDSDAFYDTDMAFHGVLYTVPQTRSSARFTARSMTGLIGTGGKCPGSQTETHITTMHTKRFSKLYLTVTPMKPK